MVLKSNVRKLLAVAAISGMSVGSIAFAEGDATEHGAATEHKSCNGKEAAKPAAKAAATKAAPAQATKAAAGHTAPAATTTTGAAKPATAPAAKKH